MVTDPITEAKRLLRESGVSAEISRILQPVLEDAMVQDSDDKLNSLVTKLTRDTTGAPGAGPVDWTSKKEIAENKAAR